MTYTKSFLIGALAGAGILGTGMMLGGTFSNMAGTVHGTGLLITDTNNKKIAIIQRLEYGGGALYIYNNQGKEIAIVAANSEGRGEIQLFDKNGKRTKTIR